LILLGIFSILENLCLSIPVSTEMLPESAQKTTSAHHFTQWNHFMTLAVRTIADVKLAVARGRMLHHSDLGD
jgi:hypothetical protein